MSAAANIKTGTGNGTTAGKDCLKLLAITGRTLWQVFHHVFLRGPHTFDDMNCAMRDHHAQERWRRGHHLFFVQLQTITITLTRLRWALERSQWAMAEGYFRQAAVLMRGSAVAMRLAGAVDPKSYQRAVIPAMLHAHEQFTGLDSADHAQLIGAYRKLGPLLEKMPPRLSRAHERFVAAVQTAVAAHVWVCAAHGGNDRNSTSASHGTGVENLKHLQKKRIAMINPKPKSKCPFAR